MAVTVIGGLLTSTLLTLVLIPAVYTIFDDASRLVSSIPGVLRRLPRHAAPKNAGRTAPWGSPKPTLAGVASTFDLSKTGERG